MLLIGDVVIVGIAFPLAALLEPSGDFLMALQVDPVTAIGSLGVAMVSVFAVLQLARVNSGYSLFDRIQQISLALGAFFILEAFLSYVQFVWQLELAETLVGSVVCGVLLVAWNFIFGRIFPNFPAPPRVLLLGSDAAFPEIGGALAAGAGGYRVFGPLPIPGNLRAIAVEYLPDEIIVGDIAAPGVFPANELLDLRFRGVAIRDAAAFFEASLQRVSCRHLHPGRFLFGDLAPKRQNLALQAIYSNFLGLAVLAISAPVLLIAAIALKISSPSQAILEHSRTVGLHGIPFERLRFQSLTKLGQWMVRARLHGLPQLFNVVRGEMSLVGPRPSRLEFNEALSQQIPYYSQRVAVRPGLTGWAQIHHAGFDASVELEYDLYYMKHLSPGFDFDIILASLFGSGSGT